MDSNRPHTYPTQHSPSTVTPTLGPSSKIAPVSYSRHSGPVGESRTEYIPYEKTIIEYEPVTKIQYVPREKKVVEYYPVEYQTEYVPQVYHQKVIDYVPVERLQQRVEYVPVEREIHYPPQDHSYEESIGSQPVSKYLPYPPTSSRIHAPASSIGQRYQPVPHSVSFRESGLHSSSGYPPQNNSLYVKEPLPSSKRHYI